MDRRRRMVCRVLQSAGRVAELQVRPRRFSPNVRDGGRGGRDDVLFPCFLCFRNFLGGCCFRFLKWFDAFLSRFDSLFAFDAVESYFLGCRVFGVGSTFLRLVDDDSFKLFFFVEEVGDVKECVAFQSDVDESGLHSGQDPHHASLINVTDDSLMLFSTFDVELSDLVVFNDRNLLLASVDADN